MKDITQWLKDIYQGGLDWPTPTDAELEELVARTLQRIKGNSRQVTWEDMAEGVIAALREAGAMK